MNNYYDIKNLENIYLEDSFVLAIKEKNNDLCFEMEFVLTEHHPQYHSPLPDEQYCYKKGMLIFKNCNSIEWKNKSDECFIDKNEEEDLGNIDTFNVSGTVNSLCGDWGSVEINSHNVEVTYK